jgi:hypothetical protein
MERKIGAESICQLAITPNSINQLPFSTAKWQHESQICFANLILLIMAKLLTYQQALKLWKHKHMF